MGCPTEARAAWQPGTGSSRRSDQPRAISAVVDQLLTEFEVDRPTCEQHVMGFLQKLAESDLLSVQ